MPNGSMPLQSLREVEGLKDPALVLAFVRKNGFNSTAGSALARFARLHDAKPVASLDPNDFYDFTVLPPSVRTEDGRRIIEWPRNDLLHVRAEGAKRDLIVLPGIEPHLGWQWFAAAVVSFAVEHGVRTALALRTWPAQVPHTRPVVMRLSTDSTELAAELQLDAQASDYEGPVDFPGLLSAELADQGIVTGGLTTIVPNYLGVVPNPMALLELTTVLDRLTGVNTDIDEVREAAERLRSSANEAVRQSDELQAAVEAMEANYDSLVQEFGAARPREDSSLPEASELLREVERFLNTAD
jgi:proteasome assembly chaperone (PAC2) family protein